MTTSIQGLLQELERRGVRLALHAGDRLAVLGEAGSVSAELRETIAAHKPALVDLLRAAHDEATALPVVHDAAARHAPFPLTEVQHAYWLGRQHVLELGGVSTHNYLEFDCPLDLDRLEQALNRVVQRHDMLRAVVDADGCQRVLPEVPPLRMERIDARALPPEQQEDAVGAVRERMSHQVLPADRAPMLALAATLLAPLRAVLHLSIDMLMLDASSVRRLLEEWRRFYQEPSWRPAPPAIVFRDLVLAARAQREGEAYRRAREHWLGRLAHLPAAPQLPVLPAGTHVVPRFVRRSHHLGPPAWAALKAHCQDRGVTASCAVLCAYAEVLRRWSREPHFTLNATTFDRPAGHPDAAQVLGDFTRVALVGLAGGSCSFVEAARAVQAALFEALEHRAFSGIEVLQERARRGGGGPAAAMPVVFTSLLGLGAGDDPLAFFGTLRHHVSQTPQVWLDCQVLERAGGLAVQWDAVEALFPAGVLDDMFGAFADLLERLAAPPAWSARRGALALPAWQQAERDAANATGAPIPACTLHRLVAAAAARTPQAVAVVAGGRSVTYAALMARARRLARQVHRLGARPGDRVAVALPKGWEQAAAVLGILQAGAAYVPVDPALPEKRRALMLAQAGVHIVVTASYVRAAWPEGALRLAFDAAPTDAEADDANSRGDAAPVDTGTPDDLAYVIYTSGSTGVPKGVAVTHRAAANTVQDVNARFCIGAGDRVLAVSSLGFDLSVWDLFGVLGAGGTVVMPAPNLLHDPAHWTELARRHGVTVWNTVPQLMQLWVDHLEREPAVPAGPRLALLSGDWIPIGLPARARALWPALDVVSLGGATEAAIWSVWHRVGEPDPAWPSVPYGKPLANQTMHVLDSELDARPAWVAGEICIGGAGLALGYWGDAQNTAARFIVHPRSGERLYRTGDLGRYRPGGDIEFLGRADRQVKLNGHRVELGEIECVLAAQPGVAAARAVVVPGAGDAAQRLVACVVATPPNPWRASQAQRQRAAQWETAVRAAARDHCRRHGDELAAGAHLAAEADALARRVMLLTLQRLGAFASANTTETPASIGERLGLPAPKRSLVARWLRALGAAGMLQRCAGGGYRLPAPLDSGMLRAEVQNRLAALPALRGLEPFVDFLRWCAAEQENLLLGRVQVQARMFPEGALDVADAVYQRLPTSELHNHIAAAALRELVQSRGEAAALRVLEVGAGTGGATAALLPLLPRERTRYVYTDVSPFFMAHAKRRFAAWPFLEYRLFDIDDPLAGQGLQAASFDLLVAANVLHNARALGRTLARLAALLAPGGVLLVQEATRDAEALLLGFGHMASFADPQDWRRGAQRSLLTAAEWRHAFARAGFALVSAFGDRDGEEGQGDQHTFVVQRADGDAAPDAAALRAALAEQLPPHMLPQRIVCLDALPLGPNGKVDVRGLPLEAAAAEPERRVAPRNEVEQRLHALWAQALERADFGVEDNLFHLGADSLVGVRLVARIKQEFRVHEDVRDELLRLLFERPTIAAIAGCLSLDAAHDPWPVATPCPQRRYEPFPLTQLGRASLRGAVEDPYFVHGTPTDFYIEATLEGVSPERLQAALREVIERHDMLRLSHDGCGMVRVLKQVPPYTIAVADLRAASTAQRSAAIVRWRQEMAQRESALDGWPMFEIRATRLAEERLVLHMSFNGLSMDSASIGMVFDEWLSRCQGLPPAPPPGLSLRDYRMAAEALGEGHPAFERARAYWAKRLPALHPPPAILPAVPPKTLERPRFVTRTLRIETARWKRLQARFAAQGLTPSAGLLAAYLEVLRHWSARASFSIGLYVSNRLPVHPDVDALAGDFTELSILGVEGAEATFGERARAAQRRMLLDLEHLHYSGVRVLEDWGRLHGIVHPAMPFMFNSVMSVEHDPGADRLSGLRRSYRIEARVADTWLEALALSIGGELHYHWFCVDALFAPGQLAAMHRAHAGLLERLVEDDRPWSMANPLSQGER